MKNNIYPSLFLFIFCISFFNYSFGQINPVLYYTFDGTSPNYSCQTTQIGSSIKATITNSSDAIFNTPTTAPVPVALSANNTHYFNITSSTSQLRSTNLTSLTITQLYDLSIGQITVEFIAKMKKGDLSPSQKDYIFFSSTTCSRSINARITFLPTPEISFGFKVMDDSPLGWQIPGNPSEKAFEFKIPLDGKNGERGDLDYYLDDTWHHFVFRIDTKTGNQIAGSLFVDGESPIEFHLVPPSYEMTFSNVVYTYYVHGDILLSLCQGTPQNHGVVLFPDNSGGTFSKFRGGFDEFAIYNQLLPDDEICEHADNIKPANLTHYQLALKTCNNSLATIYNTVLDPLEFPSGHNNIIDPFTPGDVNNHTSVGALDPIVQLRAFPTARFKSGADMHPNMNWMSARYMGGYFQASILPPTAAANSVDIQNELATNWNYLYNIAENIADWSAFDPIPANDDFADDWTDNIVNNSKNYPLCALINRHAAVTNFISPTGTNIPRIEDQTLSLPENYYVVKYSSLTTCPGSCPNPISPLGFTQENGNASATGTKFWNPAFEPSLYSDDGIVARTFFERIYTKYPTLPKLSAIGENNEPLRITAPYSVSGDPSSSIIPPIFKDNCPAICSYKNYTGNGNWTGWLGERRYLLDKNSYRDILLNVPQLGNPLYLEYGVDADGANDNYANRYYWPNFRQIQTKTANFQPYLNNFHLATPDYYPASSTYWREVLGARRGWNWFAKSRIKEIAYGDLLFAPFVSAGYRNNENYNIRPSQYLGALKSIGMLGANFFIAGFFNEAPQYGNGVYPANPKGYIWQATTPVYTQAMFSRVFKEFFIDGQLLEGDMPIDLTKPNGQKAFSFLSGNETRQLVVIRCNGKDQLSANKFLISGTIQPNGNQGNTLLTDVASITLNPSAIGSINMQFNVRRQGSVYIYDLNPAQPNRPVFWQIDKWHQYEHPEWWTKDFDFEAEVMDNANSAASINPLPGVKIETEDPGAAIPHTPLTTNFTSFTSYVSFTNPGSSLEYNFQPRQDGVANDYFLWIRARVKSHGISAMAINVHSLDNPTSFNQDNYINCISNTEWKWFRIDACTPGNIEYSSLNDDESYVLVITPANSNLEIDKIYLDASDSYTFNEPYEPSCPYDLTISNQAISSVTDSLNNLNVFIQGTLIIDMDYTVNGTIFNMDAGSSIVVNSGYEFATNNCAFQSPCSDMWAGIENNNGGRVNISNGTSIKDAIIGITCSGTSMYNIQGSSFDHNHIGLYIHDGDFTSSRLVGNIFSCTNGSINKNPYSGIKNSLTQAQIALSNAVKVSIGAVGQPKNYIYNSFHGIEASESDIVCLNNWFEVLNKHIYYKVAAIYGLNFTYKDLQIGSEVPGSDNFIKNWYYGVEANGINSSEIFNNEFSNNEFGVYIQGNANRHSVSNNKFDACSRGITFPFPAGAAIDVTNNMFNFNQNYDLRSYGAEAINIYNLYHNNNASATISGNKIHNYKVGVHLSWLDGAIINENDYYTSIPNNDLIYDHYGVLVQNCGHARIQDNKVERLFNENLASTQSTAIFEDKIKGLSVELSNDADVSGNLIKNMGTDIRVFGNCAGTQLHCNSMNDSYQGINFVSATIDNPQGSSGVPTDNSWNGTFNTTGISNKRVAGQAAGNPVNYYHRNVSPNLNLTASQYDQTAINPIITTGNNCTTQLIQGREIADIDLLLQIIRDSIVYIEFIEENRAIEDAFAFNVIKNDSTLLADSTFTSFYGNQNQSTLGLIESINEAIMSGDQDLAQALNDGIVDSTLILENNRLINAIFIEQFMNIDSIIIPDSSTQLILQQIAYQNPLSGGPAVYTARNILGLILEDNYVSARNSVSSQNYVRKKNYILNEIKVYPNPGKEAIIIDGFKDMPTEILVNDYQGKIVYHSILSKDDKKVNINVIQWPAGIYFYQVQFQNERLKGKISVIK